MNRPWIAAIIAATIFIVFRITTAIQPDLANCSPIIALLFCGAALWKTNKWILPTALLIWLISTPIVNALQGYSIYSATLTTLIAFFAIIAIGFKFNSTMASPSSTKLILGTILGATVFYLITNTISFVADPVYAKTLDGYIQCLWTGSPIHGGIPTWTFFRNSLIANTLCTSLFLAIMHIPHIQKATQFKLAKHAA